MKQTTSKPSPQHDASAAFADELGSLLDGFADQHLALLAQVQAHRGAIRKADGAGVDQASQAQTRIVGALGGLEQRRRELVALACRRFAPLTGKRSVEVTLTDLARCLEEPRRSELIRRAQDLRTLIATVHEQTGTVKAATVSLLAHMEGLMRQVGRQLSHSGTYSSRGYVEPGGLVVSALDIAT